MSVGPFCDLCKDDTHGKSHEQEETSLNLCGACIFCVEYLISSLSLNDCERLFEKIKQYHLVK